MKNKIKIVIINILIIFIIMIFAEAMSFYILNKRDPNFHYQFIEKTFEQKYQDVKGERELRPIEVGNKEGNIVFFGCCMTYGVANDDKGTISHVVHKYTGKTVINRGIPGWGLQHMYFQLTHPEFIKDIGRVPDIIVYTIIKDHYRRLFSNSSANEPYYLTYKIKNGKFIKNTNSFLNRSLVVYLIKSLYCQNHFDANLVNFYLIESYKKAKELNPNVKFIVLDMDGIEELYSDDTLAKNGIKIIDLTRYTNGKSIHDDNNKELWSDENGHPSEKYWEKVIPDIKEQFERI